MSAAILSIGTELTRGELINSNAAWLSEQLTSLGLGGAARRPEPADEGGRLRERCADHGDDGERDQHLEKRIAALPPHRARLR